MDKQKQIEEIAVIINGIWYTKNDCPFDKECPYLGRESRFDCNDCLRANALVNAGYRKIPENAVVLTGTETEERLEDLLVDFDEMSFYPATLTPNPEEYAREWKQKLIYAIDQLKKEMAEKIFKKLNEKHTEVYNEYVFKNQDLDDLEINSIINFSDSLSFKFDKICKEFTEGKGYGEI